jgi:alpha-L-fucosidase
MAHFNWQTDRFCSRKMKPTQKLMSASWAALRGQGALASCILAVAGNLAACAGEVFLTISFLLPAVAGSAAEGAANLPVPTPQQVAWHEAGIGLFFHWAPNVYQGGEGDNRSTPRDKINPDRFNAGQWVQAVKAANAGYLIFVAKHVGGYCAWQTKTTDYSLKTSPWKQGKGDMLAELAKACQAGGVRLGVYLCPRDDTQGAGDGGRAPSPEKQAAYNEIYRQQLTEILSGYGPMFEMWFDGGNIVPINDLIDRLSPGIISFQGRRTGGSRWVGTEHGFAPYPCWNTIDWKPGETPKEGTGSPNGNTWCPAECDVSILRPNWFWSEGSDKRILSLDDLIEIYYMSVGRGVNLLLNATPDSHGEVPAAQMKRLQEFGDEIRSRFAKPLFTTCGEGNNISLDFGSEQTIDHIVLREEIRGGERIRKFLVEGRRADGTWLALARGTQVGSRQIIPIPATAVTGLRLTVQESVAPVTIRELSAFRINRPVPKLAYREGR